jgi:hypothetical protein
MRPWLLLVVAGACGRGGFGIVPDGGDDADAGSTTDGDVGPDLSHIAVSPGWTVEVFRDFSADHVYVEDDFLEATSIYSNAPIDLFVLHPPFPEALGMLAGRHVVVIDELRYEAHDYGQHLPNTPGLPDRLRGAVWTPEGIRVTSSSEGAGDGLFAIATDWTITQLASDNNARDVTWDAEGTFDALGTPRLYYGHDMGVMRGDANMTEPETIVGGNVHSLNIVGDVLVLTRTTTGGMALRRIESTTHSASIVTMSELIMLADGAAPPTALGWVVVDGKRLARANASAATPFTPIADTLDPDYVWWGAAVPPPTHRLGTPWPSLYVIESNRALDIDRILRFAPDGS